MEIVNTNEFAKVLLRQNFALYGIRTGKPSEYIRKKGAGSRDYYSKYMCDTPLYILHLNNESAGYFLLFKYTKVHRSRGHDDRHRRGHIDAGLIF